MFGLRPAEPLVVGAPRISRPSSGTWRVSADVGGREAWVEADEPLAASGDAFAAMALLPATKARATLRVETVLDERLFHALPRIQGIARYFWGYRGGPIEPRGLIHRRPEGAPAMFFTGGVDSFYTLARRRKSIEQLVWTQGFDVGLADRERAADVRSSLAQIAAECGLRAFTPKTNIRTHPVFASLPWGVTHIAALATVAHAIAPVVSQVHVATSDTAAPWGSRPNLDPLWSSDAVDFLSDGIEALRWQKVRAIADWPLVHRFLRVCYMRRPGMMNCGECVKCVRTQILFALAGTRHKLQTFPQTPLVELVDRLPWMETGDDALWQGMIQIVDSAPLKAAIERLIARRMDPVERLREITDWVKRVPGGRTLRRASKRLLGA